MTKLVGIDASTKKTGICTLIDGELIDYQLLDCSHITDTEERIRAMSLLILKYLSKQNPDIVWIEDSWNAANVQVTKALTLVMGVSLSWCVSKNKEWHSILPNSWRKYCGISTAKKKRAELKQASIDYVKDKYGIDVNDDVADAIALANGVVNYYNLLEE